jgi:hypothetical protein
MKPVLFTALLAFSTPAFAGGAFDGEWAVKLVTEKGDCDRSLSWNVGVAANRIADEGMFVRAMGAVDARGRVTLTVTQGANRVSARGKLTGAAGSGAWTSPTRACSGRWLASKRA